MREGQPAVRGRALRCAMTERAFVTRLAMFGIAALAMIGGGDAAGGSQQPPPPPPAPPPVIGPKSAAVEQTSPGTKASADLLDSFDGLGFGFEGPHWQ
jgi:hypothetical protein